MSGILMALASSGKNLSLTFSGSVLGTSPATTVGGNITLNSDGTATGTRASSAGWYPGGGAGIGSQYWATFHTTSGQGFGGATDGQLYSLASAPTLSWSTSTVSTITATVAVAFYADAAATQPAGSGTITMSLTKTGGP